LLLALAVGLAMLVLFVVPARAADPVSSTGGGAPAATAPEARADEGGGLVRGLAREVVEEVRRWWELGFAGYVLRAVLAVVGLFGDFLFDLLSPVCCSALNFVTRTPPELSYANPAVVGLWRSVRTVTNGVLAAVGVDAGLEEWRGPAACARGPVRPDGYAILRLRGRRFGFFLEYDRGTERPAHHLAKLDAYYAYRDTERYARDYDGFPTILVVAPDTDAEQRIAAVAVSSAVGRSAPLPLLLTCEWRYRGDRLRVAHRDGLLGPIWRTPDSPGRRRWPVP
jgi:hypothetical protein